MNEEIYCMAKNGSVSLMLKLGYYYENVERNFDEALKWFLKAADLGNDIAQYEVGCIYKYGWNRQGDYKMVVEYFSKAYKQGYKSAMFELGGLYELGHRVECIMRKAEFLYDASK